MTLSYIEDTEDQRIFHIDKDDRWVEGEWRAFNEGYSPDRYKLVRLTKRAAELIDHARDRKLIVSSNSRNTFIGWERRATPSLLALLLGLHLIQKVGKDEYRLTDDGEKIALSLTAEE